MKLYQSLVHLACTRAAQCLLAVCALSLLPSIGKSQATLPLNWLYGSIGTPRCVAYSPDGTMVAIAGTGGVQVYSVQSGALVAPISTSEATTYAVAFTSDNKQLLIAGVIKGVYQVVSERWDIAANTLLDSFNTGIAQNTGPVVSYSPDTTQLLIGGNVPTPFLQTWSTTKDKLLLPMTVGVQTVNGVAWSADGSMVSLGGSRYNSSDATYSGVCQIWNASSGTLLQTLASAATSAGAMSIVFSRDGKSLIDVIQTNTVGQVSTNLLQVWNIATAQISSSVTCSPNQQTVSLEVTPDGTKLIDSGEVFDSASSTTSGAIDVWNIPGLSIAGSLSTTANPICGAVSPDSSTLATGATAPLFPNVASGVLQQWSLSAKSLVATISAGTIQFPGSSLFSYNSAAFSTDGGSLALGGYWHDSTLGHFGGSVGIWNVTSGRYIKSLATSANMGVAATAYSTDGITLATGGSALSGTTATGIVELWNTAAGSLTSTLPTSAVGVNSVAFARDGSLLAVGGQANNPWAGVLTGSLELWNPATSAKLFTLATATKAINSVSFASDNSLLATCGEVPGSGTTTSGVIELWNPSTGALSTTLNSSGNLSLLSVAFTPDNSVVAVAGSLSGAEGASVPLIELWNVSTHTKLTTLAIPPGPTVVNTVSFSRDGSVLFAATDCGLEVFSTATFKLLSTHAVVGSTVSVSGQASIGAFTLSPTGSLMGMATGGTSPYEWLAISQNPYFTVPVFTLVLNPTDVQGGSTSTATVTLSFPAPTGGQSIPLSSSSSAAVVPANITFPAGATTSTFIVKTNAVNAQTAAVVSAGSGLGSKSATLSVEPAALSSISAAPAVIIGGNTSTGTVTLTGRAGSAGTTVSIFTSSSVATVYGTAVVQPGQTTATFTITTIGVTNQTGVTITAILGGQQVTTDITVAPAIIVSLSVSPTAIAGGNSATGTVTLNGVAPSGGVFCQLTSNSPVATVPTGVNIPQGAISATFPVSTSVVTANKTVIITGEYGTTTQTATLSVTLPTLASVTLNPTSVPGGIPSAGLVALTGPAPKGGEVVKLSSSSPTVQVPASVTVPAGKTSMSFTAKTNAVSAQKSVTVTASLGTAAQTATLTLLTPVPTSVTVKPTSVLGGSAAVGTVTLSGPTLMSIKIPITSSSDNATIPATVTVAAGSSSGSFAIKTKAVSVNTSVTFSAKWGTVTQIGNLILTAPTLKSLTLNPAKVKAGKTSVATLTLTSAAPLGGLSVTLGSSQADAVVPTTVVIPAGKTSGTFTIKTQVTSGNPPSTISASLNGQEKTATLTIE